MPCRLSRTALGAPGKMCIALRIQEDFHITHENLPCKFLWSLQP